LLDVVVVPDRGVTERLAAASPVAQVDQVGEEPVEQPAPRVAADQGAVGGVGEQPPPPPLALRGAQQVSDDAAGQRAVPEQLAGHIGVGQGIDRDDDPDLHVHVPGPHLPGEPFHESVGDDLVPGPVVPGGGSGVRCRAERREARDALLDRQ
jgi:hypothetical protein